MSVKCQRQAEQRRGYHRSRQNAPTLTDNKAARLQDQRGNKMQTAIIILAGTAATGIITALLLRWQHDPFEEQIKEALQYESKQLKIKKALKK